MEFVWELFFFMIFVTFGILIACYCCTSASVRNNAVDQERPLPTPDIQNTSQRPFGEGERGNKSDDDPPPIFSVLAPSHMYTNRGMHLEPMDICDESNCPPPQYEDVLVIKPNPMCPSVVSNKQGDETSMSLNVGSI